MTDGFMFGFKKHTTKTGIPGQTTTHYDPILRDIDDIFGKDSVWFTEKGKDGNSNLFSLVEFRGLNKYTCKPRNFTEQSIKTVKTLSSATACHPSKSCRIVKSTLQFCLI